MGKVQRGKHAWAAGGVWSFRSTLELQENLRAARRGSWGSKKRILGLQEKDTGIQPYNQPTTNPWGLSGHEGASVGSDGCPKQPQGAGQIPRTGGCSNTAKWDVSSTTVGADLSLHPSALTALIFIPVMSSWLGARPRRKPGSAGLQLSRQGSTQDAWKRLILLQPPTAPAPNKAPSLAPAAFLSELFLEKTEKWKGWNPPSPSP